MAKLKPAFTCIKTKSAGSETFKKSSFVKVSTLTVILLKIRTQFFLFRICLHDKIFTFSINTETYEGLSKTSNIEFFGNTIKTLKPLTNFGKSYVLDVCLSSEYASQLSDMLLSRAFSQSRLVR